MPTLFAAEDLQSRLYNLLDQSGLIPLRQRDPSGLYAVETVYLLARYLAWEQLLLRFTYIATDPRVVGITGRIRRDLASDAFGTGPWTFFRPTQMALGQVVTYWHQDGALADTISFLEFKALWSNGLASDLGLEDATESLRRVSSIDELPLRTVHRLARLQANSSRSWTNSSCNSPRTAPNDSLLDAARMAGSRTSERACLEPAPRRLDLVNRAPSRRLWPARGGMTHVARDDRSPQPIRSAGGTMIPSGPRTLSGSDPRGALGARPSRPQGGVPRQESHESQVRILASRTTRPLNP